MKKKNQELEKFKFVLDYKIKELKKQIEPREEEIAEMKEQIKVRGARRLAGTHCTVFFIFRCPSALAATPAAAAAAAAATAAVEQCC